MKCSAVIFAVVLFACSLPDLVCAADHRVEVLDEPAPADAISPEIAATLSAQGISVIRGTKRNVCDIWLCKEWQVKEGFKATQDVLYPFQPGQLVGVARFKRRAGDFREQRINKGVYTLRYGHQPTDGNHEGTSPTRDFLLLVKAEADQKIEPLKVETLFASSAEAAESSHPALWCLRKAPTEGADSNGKLAIRHDEDHDLWIVHCPGKSKAGESTADLAFDVVVVGHATE